MDSRSFAVLLVVGTVLRVHHGRCQPEVKLAIGRNLLKQWAQITNRCFELVNKCGDEVGGVDVGEAVGYA